MKCVPLALFGLILVFIPKRRNIEEYIFVGLPNQPGHSQVQGKMITLQKQKPKTRSTYIYSGGLFLCLAENQKYLASVEKLLAVLKTP